MPFTGPNGELYVAWNDYAANTIAFNRSFDGGLTFGTPDYSAQVAQMKDKGVNLVISCVDGNGAASLGREMKKQGLEAIQYLPNAYNRKFIEENALEAKNLDV